MESFRTNGTCCKQIIFEVKENKLTFLKFINGCSGNLQGIARLAMNQELDYIIDKLRGIPCKGNTSCPDQLAKALTAYKNRQNQKKDD